MEAYFSSLFEDIRYERSLNLLKSLPVPDILKPSKFIDDEKYILKKSCSGKITPSKMFKGIFCFTITRLVYSV